MPRDQTAEHVVLLKKLRLTTRNMYICEERLLGLQETYDELTALLDAIYKRCPELKDETDIS